MKQKTVQKKYDFERMQMQVKKHISATRYEHTIGVMYTCASLAMAYGEDLMSAQTAGLLHDCAKGLTLGKMIRLCKKHKIEISKYEQESASLLHAKAGMILAETEYNIKDPQILSAIESHTTGRPDMSTLAKILFVADYIEPHRMQAAHLPEIRQMAFKNLDECVYMILHDTLAYLHASDRVIDTATNEAYQYYKLSHKQG